MNTRPLASQQKDHDEWERELEARFKSAWDLSEKRLDDSGDQSEDPQEDDDEQRFDERPDHRRSPDAHEEPSMIREPSFGMKTLASIVATLGTAGMIGLVNMSISNARKLDVLVERPPSVSQAQYEGDMKQIKSELQKVKEDGALTQQQVAEIKRQQTETLNQYRK